MQEQLDNLGKHVSQVFDYLKRIRQPYEDIWQDIADHVIPIREDISQTLEEGQRQGTKIYDGTPLVALQIFADGLYGYLVSPSILWFRLNLDIQTEILVNQRHGGRMSRGPTAPYISRYETLDEVPEVRSWLQDATVGLYRSFQRSKSFYPSMLPFFADGGSIGTATLYSEEDIAGRRVAYRTMHPAQVWIGENRFGDVDTVFCRERLEACKWLEMFDERLIPDAVKHAARNEPYKQFPVIHAVYPRKKHDPGKLGKLNKPIESVWMDEGTNKVVRVSGYDSLPFHVWRYWKGSTETYGRSPGMYALYDIMALNRINKDMLGAGRLAVDPAYNVPAELQHKVDIRPHGMNYYGDDPKRIIYPVQTGIQFPIGKDREDQKREAVEKHFHIDFFMMLARSTRQLTATEVLEKQGEKAVLIGSAVGNCTDKTLEPAIDRQFAIEYKAGRLPRIPDVMQEYAGESMGIEYLGPLAQAQKRLFRTQGITHGLSALIPIAQMFPEVLDVIDPNEVAEEVLEAYDFPQRAIRTPEQVKAIRDTRAEQQAALAKKQQMMEATEQVRTLSEVDKNVGGKLSEAVMGQGQEGMQ